MTLSPPASGYYQTRVPGGENALETTMMARVFKGSKEQIARQIASLDGEVREVIVFVDDPARVPPPSDDFIEDIFAEMEPYMVNVEYSDDSREAIYTRMEGE